MPLIMDGGQIVPARWAGDVRPACGYNSQAECMRVALINAMPDSALEDTELQFIELLNAAANGIPVSLKLYSLPGVPRDNRATRHLKTCYLGWDDLWKSQFDAVIITGTEPHCSDLREEPYWGALVDVLDWAERNTASTVLSCLAAHAGILYSDGIDRRPLGDKRCGVFDERKVRDHALTSGTGDVMRFPHSRWNGIEEDMLASCGYTVLTQSAEAGVNLFVKKKRKSMFVHFQGHPEYGARTLLNEYRRDIKRFIKRERETYPSMPRGYFDASSTKLLNDFRENALANPSEKLLAAFPEAAVAGTLENTWQSSATRVYRNWLHYVSSRRADTPALSPMVRAGRG